MLKSSSKLFADETRCPVLDPGRGKTKTGYLWAIARDDRPWGSADPPAVAYMYAPGLAASTPGVPGLVGERRAIDLDPLGGQHLRLPVKG